MFEEGFEFVRGGKLPGLYGGDRSCSGGADATKLGCFSTRFVWKSEGEGKLYFYG